MKWIGFGEEENRRRRQYEMRLSENFIKKEGGKRTAASAKGKNTDTISKKGRKAVENISEHKRKTRNEEKREG